MTAFGDRLDQLPKKSQRNSLSFLPNSITLTFAAQLFRIGENKLC